MSVSSGWPFKKSDTVKPDGRKRTTKRRFTDEERIKLAKEYEAGATSMELAKLHKVSVRCILYNVRLVGGKVRHVGAVKGKPSGRVGIKYNKRGFPNRRGGGGTAWMRMPGNRDMVLNIIQMRDSNDGWTWEAIAHFLNVSKSTATGHYKRYRDRVNELAAMKISG